MRYSAAASFSPSNQYTFTAANITVLQSALPGAGKSAAPLTAAMRAAMPRGGVVVCRCRARSGK